MYIKIVIYYNKHHKEGLILKEEKKIFLLYRNIKTKQPSQKLNYQKLGLFKIKKKLRIVNY